MAGGLVILSVFLRTWAGRFGAPGPAGDRRRTLEGAALRCRSQRAFVLWPVGGIVFGRPSACAVFSADYLYTLMRVGAAPSGGGVSALCSLRRGEASASTRCASIATARSEYPDGFACNSTCWIIVYGRHPAFVVRRRSEARATERRAGAHGPGGFECVAPVRPERIPGELSLERASRRARAVCGALLLPYFVYGGGLRGGRGGRRKYKTFGLLSSACYTPAREGRRWSRLGSLRC